MAFSQILTDEAQANCFFNILEHGLLCVSVCPPVYLIVWMCTCVAVWWYYYCNLCKRLLQSNVFSFCVLSQHVFWCCSKASLWCLLDLFSCLPYSEVGKYVFCFPLLIFPNVLNVTLGNVCVAEWNEEDNNMNSFSVSYYSLGQYKICYLS